MLTLDNKAGSSSQGGRQLSHPQSCKSRTQSRRYHHHRYHHNHTKLPVPSALPPSPIPLPPRHNYSRQHSVCYSHRDNPPPTPPPPHLQHVVSRHVLRCSPNRHFAVIHHQPNLAPGANGVEVDSTSNEGSSKLTAASLQTVHTQGDLQQQQQQQSEMMCVWVQG